MCAPIFCILKYEISKNVFYTRKRKGGNEIRNDVPLGGVTPCCAWMEASRRESAWSLVNTENLPLTSLQLNKRKRKLKLLAPAAIGRTTGVSVFEINGDISVKGIEMLSNSNRFESRGSVYLVKGNCTIAKDSVLCVGSQDFRMSILSISGNLVLEENSRIIFLCEDRWWENDRHFLAVKGEILTRWKEKNSYAIVGSQGHGKVVVLRGDEETWVGDDFVLFGRSNVYCQSCIWRFSHTFVGEWFIRIIFSSPDHHV